MTDHALALPTGPDGSRIIAATFRLVSSSSLTAWVSAARSVARAPFTVRCEGAWWRHLPIAQQRRRSSGRRASLPWAQALTHLADLVQPKPDVGSCQLVKPLGTQVRV